MSSLEEQTDLLKQLYSGETNKSVQPNFDDVKTVAENIETVKSMASTLANDVFQQNVDNLPLYQNTVALTSTLESILADKTQLQSIYNDKSKLDALYLIKDEITSLYNDRTKLTSIFNDKSKLDSIYADKTTIDGVYAQLANINTVITNITAIQNAETNANTATAQANRSETEADRAEGYANSINPSNYIAKDNVTPFVPLTDYNPATKKYVDDNTIDIAISTEIRTGTDDAKAATPKGINETILGMGQTWQNMLGSRVIGVVYTNNTGKPIQVYVAGETGVNKSIGIEIDGLYVGDIIANHSVTAYTRSGSSFIIPNGSTYKVRLGSIGTVCALWYWSELR